MKKEHTALVAAAGIIALLLHLAFSALRIETTRANAPIFSSRREARLQSAVLVDGRRPPSPDIRGYLERGQHVLVLWSAYSREGWACFAVTKNLDDGWVSCGALVKERSRLVQLIK